MNTFKGQEGVNVQSEKRSRQKKELISQSGPSTSVFLVCCFWPSEDDLLATAEAASTDRMRGEWTAAAANARGEPMRRAAMRCDVLAAAAREDEEQRDRNEQAQKDRKETARVRVKGRDGGDEAGAPKRKWVICIMQ